jgi:hypothetical protein
LFWGERREEVEAMALNQLRYTGLKWGHHAVITSGVTKDSFLIYCDNFTISKK